MFFPFWQTKLHAHLELSSVETPLKTETCTFNKENKQPEDTKESQNLNYTVGLKEGYISSNDECSPPDMKAETVVTEIADSVEEVSEVNDMIILVIKGDFWIPFIQK